MSLDERIKEVEEVAALNLKVNELLDYLIAYWALPKDWVNE